MENKRRKMSCRFFQMVEHNRDISPNFALDTKGRLEKAQFIFNETLTVLNERWRSENYICTEPIQYKETEKIIICCCAVWASTSYPML